MEPEQETVDLKSGCRIDTLRESIHIKNSSWQYMSVRYIRSISHPAPSPSTLPRISSHQSHVQRSEQQKKCQSSLRQLRQFLGDEACCKVVEEGGKRSDRGFSGRADTGKKRGSSQRRRELSVFHPVQTSYDGSRACTLRERERRDKLNQSQWEIRFAHNA